MALNPTEIAVKPAKVTSKRVEVSPKPLKGTNPKADDVNGSGLGSVLDEDDDDDDTMGSGDSDVTEKRWKYRRHHQRRYNN